MKNMGPIILYIFIYLLNKLTYLPVINKLPIILGTPLPVTCTPTSTSLGGGGGKKGGAVGGEGTGERTGDEGGTEKRGEEVFPIIND